MNAFADEADLKAKQFLCVGRIAAAHGLRGLVRLRSFTENPEAIAGYPVVDAQGLSRPVIIRTKAGTEFIAAIGGIDNRAQAEAAKGMKLYVPRAALPPVDPGQYYFADLIGLHAYDERGQPIGHVTDVHDFGAGTILEIARVDQRSVMLPFRDAFVPQVDLAAGRVTLVLPEE